MARRAGGGRHQPAPCRAARRRPGRSTGAHRRARAPRWWPPSWCAPRWPRPATRAEELDLVEAAHGGGVGRRARAAARRGPGRPRPTSSRCPCPASLSATARGPAARRPRASSPASSPGRCRGSPRRRPGSAPASTPGSRPGSASRRCSTPTTCRAAVTSGIDDEDDLRELIDRFESGPFGDRVPHAVEAPFALVLAGQVVRGRIDAVYAEPDGSWLVDRLEDQPRSRPPTRSSSRSTGWPGPSSSACRSTGSRAAFHYVRTGRDRRCRATCPDRAALEELLNSSSRPRPVAPLLDAFK